MKGSVKLPVFIDDARKYVNTTQLRAKYLGASYEAEYCQWQTLHGLGSLMETASLIITPNAYLEGKLIASYPPDPIGDLSVTRATTATRVNSAGLVELVPYNLLQYSEDFSNAYWTKISTSITTNSTIAPNGSTTADTITDTASGGYTIGASANVNTGAIVTYSMYCKRSNNDWIYLGIARAGSTTYGEVVSFFNINTGTTGNNNTYGTGVFIDSDIENVGNGWYRCSMRIRVPLATAYVVYVGNANTNGTPFVSDIGDATFVWGAQVNEGTAKDYQKTETRLNIPRLDYSNGTCPSLLVEPQRTNLLAYSEQFDNAGYWSTYQSSITGDTTTAPNGTQTADTLTALANTGGDAYRLINFSGTHTASCYIKAGTSNKARIGFSSGEVVFYDLSTGVVTTSGVVTGSMVDAGNGWWRCIATVNSTTIYTAFSNDGTNGQTVYLWGAQLEAGSYSTSYIPTTSASVTRNADVISKTGISSLIGQTEGVWYLDLYATGKNKDGAGYATWLIAGDSSNNFQIYNIGTTLYWYARNTGGVLIDQTANQTIVEGQRYKIAFAYKAGEYALYINGVQKRTSTNANVPAVSQFNLSAEGYGASPAIVKNEYNAVALWKTRLTNTQLAELTSL